MSRSGAGDERYPCDRTPASTSPPYWTDDVETLRSRLIASAGSVPVATHADGARPLVDRDGRTDLELVIEEILQDKIAPDWSETGYKPPRE